jgi:hypothetical protein
MLRRKQRHTAASHQLDTTTLTIRNEETAGFSGERVPSREVDEMDPGFTTVDDSSLSRGTAEKKGK